MSLIYDDVLLAAHVGGTGSNRLRIMTLNLGSWDLVLALVVGVTCELTQAATHLQSSRLCAEQTHIVHRTK